ncbi:hypothetical protein, partial [Paracoccus sanguinis]|uniref:hypothetical protein n=1 Tax=Paracoccus sanguinis TaxID=1545044 RepID=UPI00051FEC2F
RDPPARNPIALAGKDPTPDRPGNPTPVQTNERETTIAAGEVGITSSRRLPDRARAPAFDVPPPVIYPVRRAAPAAVASPPRAPRPPRVPRPRCPSR